jgi:hypothetical protein
MRELIHKANTESERERKREKKKKFNHKLNANCLRLQTVGVLILHPFHTRQQKCFRQQKLVLYSSFTTTPQNLPSDTKRAVRSCGIERKKKQLLNNKNYAIEKFND